MCDLLKLCCVCVCVCIYLCMHALVYALLDLCSDGSIHVWDGTVPKDADGFVKAIFALSCQI